MNNNIEQLCNIAQKKDKHIIGLMSGTSLDGLDIAFCKIQGFGASTNLKVLHFTTVPYDATLKNQVKEIFSKQQVNLEKLCLLNAYIGTAHATMINKCLANWKLTKADVDVIASHGQTIYHAPKILHRIEGFDNATLQIGDGDHIAVKTGIITISDFRQKHIAAGGEGAPLAVYGDYFLFSKKNENRIMLNIGGIANFTFLDGSLDAGKMFSTDIGPGNTMMDAYMQQQFTDKYFDEDAGIAKQGIVHEKLLAALKDNDFFEKDFPKTTGPELFNLAYLAEAQQISDTKNLSKYDVMATLCKFSADTIVEALLRYETASEVVVYSSGGGMHNPMLMQHIKNEMPGVTFKTTDDLNIHPDAKEAVLFAVLANEALCGENINFGKSAPSVRMGKISFPS